MWKRRLGPPVAVVAVVGVIVAGVLAIALFDLDAYADTIAAVATAVAASLAALAARESSGAARDSVLALSIATKPVLTLQFMPDRQTVVVTNESPYWARRVSFVYRPRDGRVLEHEVGALPPHMVDGQRPRPESVLLDPAPVEGMPGLDRLTMRFSGDYGPVIWERLYEAGDDDAGYFRFVEEDRR
jgi:hypothetical protein